MGFQFYIFSLMWFQFNNIFHWMRFQLNEVFSWMRFSVEWCFELNDIFGLNDILSWMMVQLSDVSGAQRRSLTEWDHITEDKCMWSMWWMSPPYCSPVPPIGLSGIWTTNRTDHTCAMPRAALKWVSVCVCVCVCPCLCVCVFVFVCAPQHVSVMT